MFVAVMAAVKRLAGNQSVFNAVYVNGEYQRNEKTVYGGSETPMKTLTNYKEFFHALLLSIDGM